MQISIVCSRLSIRVGILKHVRVRDQLQDPINSNIVSRIAQWLAGGMAELLD